MGIYINNNPFESYWDLKDGYGQDIGMFKWGWKFHNAVNVRLLKKLFSWENAYAIYYNSSSICSKDCG